MNNILGVSGSTIMSEKSLFGELLSYGVNHVEVGEFANMDEYDLLMNMISERNYSFGIHSPILRSQSKYDLAEEVHFSPDTAIKQLTEEAARLSRTPAKYLLVHFPYFEKETGEPHLDTIEDRLKKLKNIQDTYNITVVCEPKLNGYMSPYSINVMDSIPVGLWAEYGIKICIDLGDYLLAAKHKMEDMIYKWIDHVGVVHLHNVAFDEVRYRWIPIHPDDKQTKEYHMDRIIKTIAQKDNIYFVMEPTPHIHKSKEYMLEGLDWVKSIIG